MRANIVRVDDSTNVWFRGEVRNVISGVADAIHGTLEHVRPTDYGGAYRAGVDAALRAVCAAFGLRYEATGDLTPDMERIWREAAGRSEG